MKYFPMLNEALIVSIALLISANSAICQDQPEDIPPWYLSISGSGITFEGDEALKNGGGLSLRLGYDYSPRWTFECGFNYFPELKAHNVYNYETGSPVHREGLENGSASAFGMALNTLFHLQNTENRHWDPYLLAGLGFLHCDKERAFRNKTDLIYLGGGGIAYHFNNEWSLRADVIGSWTADHTEFSLLPSVGLSWKWGARVPPKFAVAGGLVDTDADGLSDKEELELGTDPRNPDTDGDGLSDGEEVKKYMTDPLNPDTDYDALLDGAEVYKHKTNPLARDTDKGGVADGHEVIEDTTNPLDPSDDLLLFTLYIEFDTDKAVIQKEYFKQLDIIGKVLARNLETTARIEGHADKRKTSVAKYNKKLSERRAKSVLNYLSKSFDIDCKRMTPVGYGFTRPLAPNDPITGNQKNRRVEIYIRYP